MTRKKISDLVRGRVSALLDLNYSKSMIISELKKENISISSGFISKVRSEKENFHENVPPVAKSSNCGRPTKYPKQRYEVLKRKLLTENPPSISSLSKEFELDRSTIRYWRDREFKLKKLQKRKVHALAPAAIEQRYQRSWPLYLQLRNDRWKNFITSDEKCFVLEISNNKTTYYYTDSIEKGPEFSFRKAPQNVHSVMVWGAVSAHGKSKLYFIAPKVKVNADYYISNIMKPFIKKDLAKLYPDGNYIFQQDSAPAHRAKKTIEFFESSNFIFLKPENWLANASDAAPMDYGIWPYLRRRVNDRNPKTLQGLKKVLTEEWNKMPQRVIDNYLRVWPRKCREIYYAKGKNIENRRRKSSSKGNLC